MPLLKLRHCPLKRRNGGHRMLENIGIGEQFKLFIIRIGEVMLFIEKGCWPKPAALVKALAMLRHIAPEKAGLPPPPGCYLPDPQAIEAATSLLPSL